MNDERWVSIMDEFEALQDHAIFPIFWRFIAFFHLMQPITFLLATICLALQENPVLMEVFLVVTETKQRDNFFNSFLEIPEVAEVTFSDFYSRPVLKFRR